jgi:uncharacterized protein (DUF58 family)
MIDVNFLSQLKRFHIIVNKRVTSSFTGSRRSSMVGNGLVINDFRPYVAGDDYRAIDWKIFARTDEYFIKRFEEERNLTTHVLVDASKSMDYTTGSVTKFEYAAMVALGFSYLSARNNERFNMALISDKTEYLKAKRSSNQMLTFLDLVNKTKLNGVLKFEDQIRKYKSNITSRSLVVIISDFLFDLKELRASLHMFKQHELRVIQVLDKSETNFGVYGSVEMEDLETGIKIETFMSERQRQTYREKMYHHIMNIEQETMHAGGKFFLFSTEHPLFDAFYQIVNK